MAIQPRIDRDSAAAEIGFVTIIEPGHPTNAGSRAMPGEPTSVAVTPDGQWALLAVHGDSEDVLVTDVWANKVMCEHPSASHAARR